MDKDKQEAQERFYHAAANAVLWTMERHPRLTVLLQERSGAWAHALQAARAYQMSREYEKVTSTEERACALFVRELVSK